MYVCMYYVCYSLTLSCLCTSNQETHNFKVSNVFDIDNNTNKGFVKCSRVIEQFMYNAFQIVKEYNIGINSISTCQISSF
jgi:transposase